jgi:5-methylcytosine-specific restriction endonuclease McrA
MLFYKKRRKHYVTVDNPNVSVTKYSNKSYDEINEFYHSKEWKSRRKEFLQNKLLICNGCQGDLSNSNQKYLNVDHIKPLRYFWDLRLDMNNLQILCSACNKAKGSKVEGIHYKNENPFYIQHKSDCI